jgi:predicted glycosyltransferase
MPVKIWAEILTPKQVLFFAPLVDELRRSGAEVLLTSRRYRETGPLAELAGLDLTYVGERGGSGKEEQLLAATKRQAEMIPIVKDFGPSVAVSVASAVCARVAFGLGIKHVAVNDSPHSEVAGRLSLPLSYHLLCPWVIPYSAWRKFGLQSRQVTTYHALDPAAWLKRSPPVGPIPALDANRRTITVRVQESDAPYLAGADLTWTDSLLESLIESFSDCNLVVLCRYDYQVREIQERFGSKCIVPQEVVSGHTLLTRTDLFIGMGGTMTAEAALMGVPAISAFQGTLFTDRYLESVGLLERPLTVSAVVRSAKKLLNPKAKEACARKAKKVLDSMEDPVPKIAGFVEKIAKQG